MHDSKKSASVANMGVKFSASINVRKQWLDIGKSKKNTRKYQGNRKSPA